jgi:hypothetical protein
MGGHQRSWRDQFTGDERLRLKRFWWRVCLMLCLIMRGQKGQKVSVKEFTLMVYKVIIPPVFFPAYNHPYRRRHHENGSHQRLPCKSYNAIGCRKEQNSNQVMLKAQIIMTQLRK